jgi:hypothetical protein
VAAAALGAVLPPDRFAVYLTGSSAESSASADDIDLVVIWRAWSGMADEADRVRRAGDEAQRRGRGRLELLTVRPEDLRRRFAWLLLGLQAHGRHLSGPDLLADVPLPSLDDHVRSMAARAVGLMSLLRRGVKLVPPFGHPHAHDPFYGYTTNGGTKALVNMLSAGAGALAAKQLGGLVLGKRHGVELFGAGPGTLVCACRRRVRAMAGPVALRHPG